MTASSANQTVVVEVPVTLRIAVAFPDGAPADARQAATELASEAARRLTHVSAPRLRAFNEVNRLHPHGEGVLAGMECGAVASP
ncbi:MAG: hypothetical protein NVV74_07290 [Magnetospirillum sp.]|nr:hypothetical protein [Magnetospirillum sp.]